MVRGLTRLWRRRAALEVDAAPAAGGVVARVLAARGLTDPAVCRTFLNPSLTQLHDPSLIPDLDRAAARVLDAVAAGHTVAIYGDYDVDGVTATAILYHTIRAIRPDANLVTYVPHRLDEGYGLNAAAMRTLAAKGARVVVSVDCGITAIEPARAAREAGLDLIITDHHNPPASVHDLPPAFAVVHPRRPDSAYPFGDLSGAGVAYKLAWRLATLHCGASRVSADLRTLLIDLLALAALGAVADVMPLLDENRVIARFGLARVKHSSLPGLRALVRASGLAGEEIDSEHAGFALAPRLNACGRLGHAARAVELFTTATGEAADAIALELTRLNSQRQDLERRIAREATALAEQSGMASSERRAIVLASRDWHPGVLGIVCSRLVERFHRPTILMQIRDGVCHGSGRSIEGYSLHAGLAACATHLSTWGGHDMAAGLALPEDRLASFARDLDAHARGVLRDDQLVASISYDTDATLDELTPATVGELESLAPFGVGNPRPRIRLRRVRVMARPVPFGSASQHAGVLVSGGGHTARLVGWNWASRATDLKPGQIIDAVVKPKLSRWNGRVSVEPELDDLMVH